jgi:OmpA-OmpF porin, OOP family
MTVAPKGLIVFYLSLLCFPSFAQTPFEVQMEKGHKQFVKQAYRAAILAYDSAIVAKPDHFDGHYYKGVAHYALGEYLQAQAALLKAELIHPRADALLFYLAECAFMQTQYEKALPLYERFLKQSHANSNLITQSTQQVKNAKFAAKGILQPIKLIPNPLPNGINTPGEEANAITSADNNSIIWYAHRSECTGGQQADVQYQYGADLFVINMNEANVILPFGQSINTAVHEKEHFLTADRLQLYFARHPLNAGKEYNCDIFLSQRLNNQWQTPKPLPPSINSPFCDSWPTFSAEGQNLYFASDRPGGFGGYDIWVSQRKGEDWSQPLNLGPTINTPGDEFDPFIDKNVNFLYFSSNFHAGFGGFDIFRSQKLQQKWATPQNIGYPLNTPYDEMDWFIDSDEKNCYFNSNRPGGLGMNDIYSFQLPKYLLEK